MENEAVFCCICGRGLPDQQTVDFAGRSRVIRMTEADNSGKWRVLSGRQRKSLFLPGRNARQFLCRLLERIAIIRERQGEIERTKQFDSKIIIVGKVQSLENMILCHVTTFIKLRDDKICEMEEYSADDGEIPWM